jgi:Domain of unknown function (DUF4304)
VTAQDAFDRLVRDGVWPCLRAHGFKRTKSTFHRPTGENWQVVNLQKSRWSDRRSVEFTANLAVGLDRLRERQYDWAKGKRPPESRCQLRARIGDLLRNGDVWWELGPRTDLPALADTINTALERYAFSWLDARSTDDGLLALLRSREALRAEPIHHLHWFEKLAAQSDDDALLQGVVVERERKEAELDERRRLEDAS